LTPAFSLFGVGHPDGAQGHGMVRAMLDRMVTGEVPAKHHLQLRGADGALRFEECFTRDGFDGPFTILYHLERPHLHQPSISAHGWTAPTLDDARPMAKRHYRSGEVVRRGGAPVDAFVPLLHSTDLVCGVAFPDAPIRSTCPTPTATRCCTSTRGGGTLITPLGDLTFEPGDYVCIPRAIVHRLVPSSAPQHWLWFEVDDVHLLKQWRNGAGQLRMDAPYCHRDFRRPVLAARRATRACASWW
jgi:homogentisate 1,2-dioxygenase